MAKTLFGDFFTDFLKMTGRDMAKTLTTGDFLTDFLTTRRDLATGFFKDFLGDFMELR
jgi:hypothetical protein